MQSSVSRHFDTTDMSYAEQERLYGGLIPDFTVRYVTSTGGSSRSLLKEGFSCSVWHILSQMKVNLEELDHCSILQTCIAEVRPLDQRRPHVL